MSTTTSPMILGTLGLAIVAVTLLWRFAGPVVALAVMGGYLGTALLTGARFTKGWLWVRAKEFESVSFFSSERGWWPSKVATALAGLPAPSILGLLLARGVDVGWNPRTVLIVLLILLGLLALIHGNWYTLLVIVAVAVGLAVLIYQAGPRAQLGSVVALSWLFLLGGLRYNIEMAGYKHTGTSGSFPGILQRLTDIPGVVWSLGFLFVALSAAIAGSRWLLY
jgi:hypothetical protein